jgi:energy-coupling factor transport system permease protein
MHSPRGLRSFDPRAKLMLMASASTVCLLREDLLFLFIVLCVPVATLLAGRTDGRAVWNRVRALFVLIASLFLLQTLFFGWGRESGDALLSVFGVGLVYPEGIVLAAALSLRLVIIVVSAAVLIEGEIRDYMLALLQMRFPYEIVFMVMIGLHFLPILREEAVNVYQCMQLRGREMKKIRLPEKLRAYAGLCLPVLVSTLRRADETSVAMEIRGFRAMPRRTSMRRLTLRKRDVFFLVFWPALFAALCVLIPGHP